MRYQMHIAMGRQYAANAMRMGVDRFQIMNELLGCGFTEVEARLFAGLPVSSGVLVPAGADVPHVLYRNRTEFVVPTELASRLMPLDRRIDIDLMRN